jgi:hypothetical protein
MKILLLALGITLTGCVTEKTIVSSSYRFKDGIAYKEERYRAVPIYNEKVWHYIAAQDAPDDGKAKVMKLLPTDLSMDNPHPHILNQEQWADKYHKLHPECSYHYPR